MKPENKSDLALAAHAVYDLTQYANFITKFNALGLSVYYPVVGSAGDQTYLDLNFAKQPGASWPTFLATVAQNRQGNSSPPLMVSEVNSNLTASIEQPAAVRFSIDAGQPVYDYRAAVVDHQLSGQSNRVVYLGEVWLSLAKGSNNYQFQWNGTLPMLTSGIASESAYFGGFFDDAAGTIMTGYEEYTPPGVTNSQSVVLLVELNPDGSGQVIDALDAGAFDDSMGPHGIDLEPGGTLKPVYYLERRPDPDPDHWIGDDFLSSSVVTIPDTGMTGLSLVMKRVPAGLYSLEVQAMDFYQNLSDPLVYYVTVNPPAPTLQIASLADGNLRISWPSTATGYIPQFTTNLSHRTWSDLSTNSMTIDGANNVLVLSKSADAQFYRLLKR